MIHIENLWKKFGRFEALRGLSFDVPEGSAFAMIGANGAGKTTTIKVLMNILTPTTGSATLLGVDSRKLSPRELAQIGYVSENQDMPSRLTVEEYIAYLRPFYPTWDRDLEALISRQLRLPLDRKIGDLSHGMRMKMALMCALPYRPKLLVLDEPFSGLDPLVRDEFMEGLLDQAGEMTILISSHELAEIDGVATHVAFLDEGRVLFQESMSDLTSRFRAVHVTLDGEATWPSHAPEEWMEMRTIGNVLTFVDTRFDEIDLSERIRSRIEGVREIDLQPMALRSIFTTLARARRATAGTKERQAEMVWHIFKKDWKQLWAFVITVASLHWIAAFIMFKLGLFGEDAMLEVLSETVPTFAFFGSMFLIAAIVQLEAIPGTRQDWLTRPIPRGSLLLEKFVFVVIMVEGPIFAANLFQGIANGFSLRLSFLSAISHIIFLLFFLILPLFAFASVTKNMTEAFIFGCGCTFIIFAFLTLADYMNASTHGTLVAVTHSGIGWIGEVFRFALVALAAGVILGLQYFRGKTITARVLMIAFGLLLLTSQFLPWQPAFAIQERLSPKPDAGAGTQLLFDPGAGTFKPPSGLSENSQRGGGKNVDGVFVPLQTANDVFLPLHIAGVRNDAILLADRVEVHVIGQDGRVIYHGTGDNFEVPREGPKPLEAPVYQKIAVPMRVYLSAKDQLVQVRVDYSLTLFGLARSYSLPALDGAERMPAWGFCKTKMNEAGTAVELRCMEPGKGPICGTAFLENASAGVQNPARSSCRSDYGPFRGQPLPDNFSRFGTNLPFRDPSGLAKFPVDGSQLPQSRVVIRMYEPEDHFTRSLLIPQIRLKDWEAQ